MKLITTRRLDERDDGDDIQAYLAQKTNQRTVPNIFISTSYRLLRMQQVLTSPVPLRPEAHRWYVRHAV